MMNTDKKSEKRFWQRLNDAVTEKGVENVEDVFDWDQRVKLPEWVEQEISAKGKTYVTHITAPKFLILAEKEAPCVEWV